MTPRIGRQLLYEVLQSPVMIGLVIWLAWFLILASTGAWGGPTGKGNGPAAGTPVAIGNGPAYVSGVTSTTLPGGVLPVAGTGDANCPATIPGTAQFTTVANTLQSSVTCATAASGTPSVSAIKVYLGIVNSAGIKLKCSVYNYPAGYVAGTTSVTKLAAGCDTTEFVTATANANSWVTLPTTGACTLAPSTRYFLSCNSDNSGSGMLVGNSSCGNCAQQVTGTSYAGTPLPTPWTANNQVGAAMAYYAVLGP